MPGLIGSLLLLITGAIAKYAYSDSVWSWTSGGETHSIRVDTVGMIFLIAGLVALLISIAWGFKSRTEVLEEEETVVVEEEPDVLPVKAKKNRSTRKSGN